MNQNRPSEQRQDTNYGYLLLVIYWTVAGIPLVWGIAMTLKKTMALFR